MNHIGLFNEGITVLSLFDGMSCGQLALQKAGIKVKQYIASEIDKYTIQVTQKNFPNTIQVGDVTKVFAKDLPKIDLIIGGSPCQGFSFAGKGLNFEDPRSKLFFEFVRLINECNPKWFFLENVKMKKEHELVISQYMNVAPIEINSALVSAQNRVRLYWTNINEKPYGLFGDMMADIPQPKDKGILLKDILETDVDEKYYLSDKMLKYFHNRADNYNSGKVNIREEHGNASTLTASMSSCDISDNFVIDTNGRIDDKKTGALTAKYNKGASNFGSDPFILDTNLNIKPNQSKANCFTAGGNSGGLHSDMTLIANIYNKENNPQAGRVYTSDNKSVTLKGLGGGGGAKTGLYLTNKRIRRLTPTECERLQTVPDGYTDCISDTQRYRMLGNGWTVDVVAHFFSFLKLYTNSNNN